MESMENYCIYRAFQIKFEGTVRGTWNSLSSSRVQASKLERISHCFVNFLVGNIHFPQAYFAKKSVLKEAEFSTFIADMKQDSMS